MMKMKYLLLTICSLLLAMTAGAQKLTVEKVEVAPMDLSASTQPRNDRNGNPCALVKVLFPTVGVTFEGNVLGQVEYKAGEYWVYMSEGSYMLNVKHPNFYPLMVNFRDYGIKKVEGMTTYVLTLVMPQMGPVNVDDGMRYLTLMVEPKNSRVTVDGQMYDADADGSVSVYLPQGSHSYLVEAAGYAPEQGSVVIGSEKVTKEVRLQSVLAHVQISCATAGAQIYVNNQLKGTTPWSGTLAAGNYQIEARLQGYHSSRQTETLAERANRTIQLPALIAMTGNLNVNYKPTNAEVWLDGKKLGTSPDVFRNIIIGTHQLELRMDGYLADTKTITVEEGKTLSLTGTMTPKPKDEFEGKTASEIADVAEDYYFGRNGKTQDYAMAVKWARKAAEQGNSGGQYRLGVCYNNGQGVTQDYAEAVKWYRKAADQGDDIAQYNLGVCYYNGQGVTQDYAEAVKWYLKAADQGHARAQNNLGYCYKNGQGVTQDRNKAKELWRKAAAKGDQLAKNNLKKYFNETY